jgi:hypothetical protein
VAAAAEVLWQTAGRIGAHRLQPFVPELLDRLTGLGELTLAPAVDTWLRHASAATLGRLLAPGRACYPARGATTTQPGTWLKHEIPIRTFTDWDDARPGFLEIDLVAHCGSSTLGFYLCTLCTVDIVTCWVELDAVWGKGQERVGGAVPYVHARLPIPLLGLDSDKLRRGPAFRDGLSAAPRAPADSAGSRPARRGPRRLRARSAPPAARRPSGAR